MNDRQAWSLIAVLWFVFFPMVFVKALQAQPVDTLLCEGIVTFANNNLLNAFMFDPNPAWLTAQGELDSIKIREASLDQQVIRPSHIHIARQKSLAIGIAGKNARKYPQHFLSGQRCLRING